MLVDWKAEQDEMKEILGDEYMDYNLVMASTFGLPLVQKFLNKWTIFLFCSILFSSNQKEH